MILKQEILSQKIYLIRGEKVMLDFELADLYNVKTKALKQAVKRNLKRFPDDFVFELTEKEHQELRSQIVTSSGVEPVIYQWHLPSRELQCYQVS